MKDKIKINRKTYGLQEGRMLDAVSNRLLKVMGSEGLSVLQVEYFPPEGPQGARLQMNKEVQFQVKNAEVFSEVVKDAVSPLPKGEERWGIEFVLREIPDAWSNRLSYGKSYGGAWAQETENRFATKLTFDDFMKQ